MSKTIVTGSGERYDVPDDKVEAELVLAGPGGHVESNAERVATDIHEQNMADAPIGDALGFGVLRGVSFGGTDAAIRAGGGEAGAYALRTAREAHPIASTGAELLGGIALPGGGIVGRAGAAIGRGVEGLAGGGRLAKVLGGGASGIFEGGVAGFGEGVTELALSEEPVDIERMGSVLSSRTLFGAGVGGVAGSVAKTAEIGLQRAKGALDEWRDLHAASESVPADLASMDVKQLRVAEKAEHVEIEAARVTERKAIADDLAALKREVKESNQWATTKDLALAAAEGKASAAEIGRVASRADNQISKLLDNPTALATNPYKARAALDALQQQETAMTRLLERGDDLRAAYAADGLAGKRMAALDAAPAILDRNRAIQERIKQVIAPPSSAKLDAIGAARDAMMSAGKGEKSIAEQMLSNMAFSGVTSAVANIAIPGAGLIAPLLGAKASKLITGQLFGRLGKATSEASLRSAAAASKFLEVGSKAAGKAVTLAPPLATKVLSRVRFAPSDETDEPKKQSLPAAFKARSEEIRSQTMYDATGKTVMRPEARAKVAERLAPITAINPVLGDKLETIAARRLEFLASKIPRRPDIMGIQIGPDRWQPSDMEMRRFARYVSAVEDPGGVEDRLAHGVVSPEDAEVMQKVYPERHAAMVQSITEQLPNIRGTLPYNRRLALSIFSGVPVVPAMDPAILSVLQSQYDTEGEQDGGEVPGPTPKPQFGSVKAPEPTAAQERAS